MWSAIDKPISADGFQSLPVSDTGHELARRARAAVLTGLLLTIGMLGTAVALVNDSKRDPVYNRRLLRLVRQIHETPAKPFTVVMLGSSRTMIACRSNELRETLSHGLGRPVAVGNFGIPGCGPAMNLLTWDRLLRDGIRPDFVLIEVMPAMLSEDWLPWEFAVERLPPSKLRRTDLPIVAKYFGDVRKKMRRDWLLALPNALYDSRLDLLNRFASGLLPVERRGQPAETALPEDLPALTVDMPLDERQRLFNVAREPYTEILKNYHLGGRSCVCFRELLANVRRAGVPAALVVMPEGAKFRSLYAPGAYQQVTDWLGEMRAEFGVEVIDAHDWREEDDFFDSHHLSLPAAVNFITGLGKDHLLPIMRGLPR